MAMQGSQLPNRRAFHALLNRLCVLNPQFVHAIEVGARCELARLIRNERQRMRRTSDGSRNGSRNGSTPHQR